MVTKVLVNRLQGLGKQVVGAGREVACARQSGCMCWVDRLQVPGRQAGPVVQVRQA